MTDENRPWLTFDCYDTLVRYTENKAAALAGVVCVKGGDDATLDAVQTAFEARERALQLGPFIVLSEVLRQSLKTGLDSVGMATTPDDEQTILDTVMTAAPFSDVRPALNDLRRGHRFAILSNSELFLISHNIAAIGIEFDAVVLAAEAKCYKPDPGMFRELLTRIDEVPENVTHIAQSFYHDIRTAKDLGFGRRFWINRYGHIGDPAYTPDAELPDLSGLPALLNSE